MKRPSVFSPMLSPTRLLRRLARAARLEPRPGHQELSCMDDRGLCDLGIGRGEIPYWLDPRTCDERGGGRST
jgi:uncharacterized protein YjiS (DUF1127 family)